MTTLRDMLFYGSAIAVAAPLTIYVIKPWIDDRVKDMKDDPRYGGPGLRHDPEKFLDADGAAQGIPVDGFPIILREDKGGRNFVIYLAQSMRVYEGTVCLNGGYVYEPHGKDKPLEGAKACFPIAGDLEEIAAPWSD